jgi:hypothetical protein
VVVIRTQPDLVTTIVNIVLAVGTIGVAVAAVWVALWTNKRANERAEAGRTDADNRLQEANRQATERLATQIAHRDEELRQERQLAREQEQLSEAWSVQVLGVRIPPGENVISTPENPSERPVAIAVNRGRFTITGVDACFSDGTATFAREDHQYYPDAGNLPPQFHHDVTGVIGEAYFGVLTPGWGMRLIGGAMLTRNLRSVFPIVRWTDRWGARWEHKHGEVRRINADENWKP